MEISYNLKLSLFFFCEVALCLLALIILTLTLLAFHICLHGDGCVSKSFQMIYDSLNDGCCLTPTHSTFDGFDES